MKRNMMMRTGLVLGAAGLLLAPAVNAAGTTTVCSVNAAPGGGGGGLVFSGTSTAPHANGSGEYSIIATDDGNQKYEIIVNEDGVDARVNGLRLSPDRVVRSDNQVILLDDAGKEMKVITLAPRVQELATLPGVNVHYDDANIQRPPVMLGVLLESPGDALRAHLDLPEHALILENVMEGLPADEAGLEQWDIVVEVNGESLDDEEALHHTLMESEPGDEVDLVVIRHGKERKVSVSLAAYDAEALGNDEVSVQSVFPGGLDNNTNSFFWNNQQQPQIDSARKAIEEAMRAMGIEHGSNQSQMNEARRNLERAMRQLEAQRNGLPSGMTAWRLDDKGRLLRQDNSAQRLDDMTATFEDRLEDLEDQIEDRLEELDDRWEQVEDMLDRMFAKIERRLDEALDDRSRNRDD